MDIFLKIVQIFFYLIASGLFFNFVFSGQFGGLLASFVCGGGAYASFALDVWWPLLAAFLLAWVLRLMGLDPNK
jgi:hypothetical protein